MLSDIHGGIYGHHATPRTLVGNAFRQGFYWPTTVADVEQMVRTYEGSKRADDGPPDLASRASQPTAPSGPEVMELEEDPTTEPDPLDDWRTLYLDYLLRDTLPTDKTEARQLAHHAKSFVLVEGEHSLDRLYPLLRTFFGTNNMSSNRLDVGTFGPNQCKPRVL